MSNIKIHLQDTINEIYNVDAFNEFTHDANNLSDEMCHWICNYDLDNNLNLTSDEVEDLIDQYFDDVVVMMYQRAKTLGVTWKNTIDQEYIATLDI